MRVARDAGEIEAAIEGARREAEKSFGDGALLLEKYIENARHVEFQILGDLHGNLVHIFERDCSIQRRHQKVIEESPSPALTEELRRLMGEAAVAAGRAIGYANAGTVEFILAPDGKFYFIEVNTRLQVEHPVTEMITGLDLVKLQIEIAEGKRLPFAQGDLRRNGHAIEARLYAEDPANDFLPATGTVYDWEPPASVEGLRIDTGVERGIEVGIYYDPMLAKLIAHGPDRETALRKLSYALRNLSVQGVQTNRDFLIRLLEHPVFREGKSHTGFIREHLPELVSQEDRAYDLTAAAVVALFIQKTLQAENQTLPNVPLNYRNNPYRDPSVKLQIGAEIYEVAFRLTGDDTYRVACRDWQAEARIVDFHPEAIRLSLDGIQRRFRVIRAGDRYFVHSPTGSRTVTRLPQHPAPLTASEQETANATMPGQVIKILVAAGQQVAVGDALVILEAMKMEQTIRAATDGVVESILVKTGDVVGPGEPLVHIHAAQDIKESGGN